MSTFTTQTGRDRAAERFAAALDGEPVGDDSGLASELAVARALISRRSAFLPGPGVRARAKERLVAALGQQDRMLVGGMA